MKHLKRYNELIIESKDYSDEDYIIIAERTFYELEEKFCDNQFFPLKVTLEEHKGKYNLTIALGLGWITRMSDDDIDWLNDYLSELNQNNNLHSSFMGDSSGRMSARKLFFMKNNDFPKSSMDYLNFPPGKYPDR
jgi:hypothetical protein